MAGPGQFTDGADAVSDGADPDLSKSVVASGVIVGDAGRREVPGRPVEDSNAAALVLERLRSVQRVWADWPLRRRLRVLRTVRVALGRRPRELADTVSREAVSQTLAAEVLPLLDAMRFLERESRRVLRERRLRLRGRPSWLCGTAVFARPEPLGVVLVIGPANYPLLLPGVPLLQALVAGNAVLVKPAPGGRAPLVRLVRELERCGLPEGLVEVLSEDVAAVAAYLKRGVDKVILTGSAKTGRAVLRELAETTTPAVLELSGCDAVIVLTGANLRLVVDCLLLGFTLNEGRTCLAPRRVFAEGPLVDKLLEQLRARLSERGLLERDYRGPAVAHAVGKIREALSQGAVLRSGALSEVDGVPGIRGPVILDGVTTEMSVARDDLFVPVVSFLRVVNEADAVRSVRDCPYALGASVFGPLWRCHAVARSLDVGCVIINDMIVPSADPRVSFGGRHASGFGMTRGALGLQEMTQVKHIIRARPFFRPHLEPPCPADADVLESLIRLEHASNLLVRLWRVPGILWSSLKQFWVRRAEKRSLR